jgi:hypothetical protein
VGAKFPVRGGAFLWCAGMRESAGTGLKPYRFAPGCGEHPRDQLRRPARSDDLAQALVCAAQVVQNMHVR